MKKFIAVAIALAVAVSHGSPAITPTQLTNAVEDAKAELRSYTDAGVEGVSNWVHNVTEGLTNLTGVAKLADVTNALDEAKLYADGAASAAQTDAQTAANAYTDGEVSAAKAYTDNEVSNGDDATYARMKAYVDTIAFTNGGSDLTQIADLIATDDELHTSNGVFYVTVLEMRAGRLQNVNYYFEPTNEVTYGTELAAQVWSSDDPAVGVNSFYAKSGNAYINSKVSHPNYTDGGIIVTGQTETVYGNTFVRYYASGTYSNTVDDVLYVLSYSGDTTGSNLEVTETFFTSNLVSGVTTTVDYDIELIGFLVFHDTWSSATGKQTYDGVADGWASKSGLKQQRFEVILKQITGTAFAAPRKATRQTAPLKASTVVSAVGMGEPQFIGDYVSIWGLAKNGETSETHKAYPAESIPNQAQWGNELYWTAPAVGTKAKVTYRQEDGTLITKETKIKTDAQFWEIWKGAGLPFPPKGYPNYGFKKKNDKCYKGHIWGADCVCTVCGERRSHEYDPATGAQCSRCKNHYTKSKKDEDDILVPDGELPTQCKAKCNLDGLQYHANWHHLQVVANDDTRACCCECGYYSPSRTVLLHSFPPPEETTTWTDNDDGHNHYCYLYCSRSQCNHRYKKLEGHTVDTTKEPTEWEDLQDGKHHRGYVQCDKCTFKNWITEDHYIDYNKVNDWTFVDYDGHLGHGNCEKCTAENIEVTEAHELHDDREGPDLCYCDKCSHYCHDLRPYGGCGKYVQGTETCNRCGLPKTYIDKESQWWSESQHGTIPVGQEVQEHDFDPPWASFFNEEHHTCGCGTYLERHTFVNGICTKCQYKQKKPKNGHACCLGLLRGKGDDDPAHKGNESGRGVRGGCPCGTNIYSMFPNYDSLAPAAYLCMSHGFEVYASSGGGTGDEMTAAADANIGYLFAAGEGASANFELWLNGRAVVNDNPFLEVHVTNMVYDIKISRSGVVAVDEDGVKYIQW